jgi:hypothetical protein
MTCNDLFCNFDPQKLTGKGNIKRTYKCADKHSLAKQIFMRVMYVMIQDLIEGGNTFMLPSRRYFELRMRRIPKDGFARMRQAGYMQEIDVVSTGGHAYEPVLVFKRYGQMITRPVKLSKNFREMLAEKMNTGYRYC